MLRLRLSSSFAAILLAFAFIPGSALGQVRRVVTLDEAIRRALETHPSVAAAAEAVHASRGARLTARSWTNPTLNYQVEHEAAMNAQMLQVMERKTMAFAML